MTQRNEDKKPELQGLLLCDTVLQERRGAVSLIRIGDRFEVPLRSQKPGDVYIPVVLYTKWGNGRGYFVERVFIQGPAQKVPIELGSGFPFKLDNEKRGHQNMQHMMLAFTTSGDYRIDVGLDGYPDPVASTWFSVELRNRT